ncbi:MAG: 23S rRNA (guanosine(2251)-2'-O)-methyltransferase RlmB [Pseudomonadota bacterium]
MSERDRTRHARHLRRERRGGAAADADLVFGLHAVRHLLEAQGEAASTLISRLLVQTGRDDERLREVVALASGLGVTVEAVPRSALDQRVRGRHQGVIACYAERPTLSLDALTAQLLGGADRAPLLLVLDGVQDPHNLGACLRSANAVGVDAVIVPRDRAAGLSPTVRKVACGAAESTPLVTVTNLARALGQLREAGVRLIGTSDQATETLWQADLRGPTAIVMGGEAKGLRRLTAEACDQLVQLPMAGVVESLNVSVAAGVCLFEAARQRTGACPS